MIHINDKPYVFEKSIVLLDLLHLINIDTGNGIAIALNNSVVPREKWNVQLINDNDKLLLIKATQGG